MLDEGQPDPSHGPEPRGSDTDEQEEARMMRALSMMSGGAESHRRGGRPGGPDRGGAERMGFDRSGPDRSGSDRVIPDRLGGHAGALRAGPTPSGSGARGPAGNRRPASPMGAGNPRRHRFVQDGEVPVVSVARPRRDPIPGLPGPARPLDGISSRPDDLGAERALRADAERRLGELAVQLRSHQTRLGDAELARDAAEAELRELRAALHALQAENATLLAALNARRRPRPRPDGPDDEPSSEPEPVKWWA